MAYGTWNRNFKRIVKRAGISKAANPHLLRHSRATELANGTLTESQMKELFGRRKNSGMPEIYVHLSMRNVNESLLKHYGVKVEAAKEDPLTPKLCPWCKTMNSPSAKFCQSCNVPLDPVSTAKAAERQKQRFQFVMDVFGDLASGTSLEDALKYRRSELKALME